MGKALDLEIIFCFSTENHLHQLKIPKTKVNFFKSVTKMLALKIFLFVVI